MSEYTTNYELDKYSSYDKPNLRDQYNSAMDKIDTALHEMHVDVYDAKETAQRASQAVSGEATAREDADTALQTAIDNEALARGNADTQIREDFGAADTALGNRISALESKGSYIGIIGDSFSDSALGSNWATAFGSNIGRSIVNVADNGSGLIRQGVRRGTTFKTQLDELAANEHFSEMDTIIVYGGCNDRGRTNNEITTAASEFMNTYLGLASTNRLPRLLFIYGNTGHPLYFGGDTAGTYKNYPAWLTNARRLLSAQGIPVVDGAEYWLMCMPSNMYQADHIHPNGDGYAEISSIMETVYNGSYNGVHRYYNEQIQGAEGVTVESYGRAILKFDNGVTQMGVGGLTFDPSTLTNPTGSLCTPFANESYTNNYGSGFSQNDGVVFANTSAFRLAGGQICQIQIHRYTRAIVPKYMGGYNNIGVSTYDIPLTLI